MKKIILRILFILAVVLVVGLFYTVINIYFNGIKCTGTCAVDMMYVPGVEGIKDFLKDISLLIPLFIICILYQLFYLLKLRRN